MTGARPRATVVVPTFERKDTLLRTLEALRVQDCPAESWEAVVVDDGSRDGTPAAVEAWIERSGAAVRYVRQENRGAAAARNRGAAEAAGEHLLFIDNDIRVPRDFVSRHLSMLAQNPGCWIVGKIKNAPGLRDTPFGRYRDDRPVDVCFARGTLAGGPRLPSARA